MLSRSGLHAIVHPLRLYLQFCGLSLRISELSLSDNLRACCLHIITKEPPISFTFTQLTILIIFSHLIFICCRRHRRWPNICVIVLNSMRRTNSCDLYSLLSPIQKIRLDKLSSGSLKHVIPASWCLKGQIHVFHIFYCIIRLFANLSLSYTFLRILTHFFLFYYIYIIFKGLKGN